MVPVGEREDVFLVIIVGDLGINHDESAAQTVWVLRVAVRVVPVGASLVDLYLNELVVHFKLLS